MLHARKDYNRIQDLAAIRLLLLDMIEGSKSRGNEAEARAIQYVIAVLEQKYGPLDVEPIPADEPVFLLRAKDKAASHAVYEWASTAFAHGADRDMLAKAFNWADIMKAWPVKQVPDMPEEDE
jgi:hypothetical protein